MGLTRRSVRYLLADTCSDPNRREVVCLDGDLVRDSGHGAWASCSERGPLQLSETPWPQVRGSCGRQVLFLHPLPWLYPQSQLSGPTTGLLLGLEKPQPPPPWDKAGSSPTSPQAEAGMGQVNTSHGATCGVLRRKTVPSSRSTIPTSAALSPFHILYGPLCFSVYFKSFLNSV